MMTMEEKGVNDGIFNISQATVYKKTRKIDASSSVIYISK